MIIRSNYYDYYEEDGCCLTCPDAYPRCLCYACKCRQCAHYDVDLKRCSIAVAAQDKWENVGIEIDEIVTETEKAWCVKMDTIKTWVPKSMAGIETEIRSERHYSSDGTLSHWQNKTREVQMVTLPKWLAFEKKLCTPSEFDYYNPDDEE